MKCVHCIQGYIQDSGFTQCNHCNGTGEMDPKKTFSHHFPNGNVCTITIDLESTIKVTANWKRKPDGPEWDEIEKEYLAWLADAVKTFLRGIGFPI